MLVDSPRDAAGFGRRGLLRRRRWHVHTERRGWTDTDLELRGGLAHVEFRGAAVVLRAAAPSVVEATWYAGAFAGLNERIEELAGRADAGAYAGELDLALAVDGRWERDADGVRILIEQSVADGSAALLAQVGPQGGEPDPAWLRAPDPVFLARAVLDELSLEARSPERERVLRLALVAVGVFPVVRAL